MGLGLGRRRGAGHPGAAMSHGAQEPFDRLVRAAAMMIYGDWDDPP